MGGGSNAMPARASALVVYGDLYSCDTRTVLTILNMTEVNFVFKEQTRTRDMMRQLSNHYDQFSLDYISKVVPVLEEDGFRRIGSGQEII